MTQPQPVLIGVDVGSTHTSGGIVTTDGEVLSMTETRTHRDGPGTALDTILGVVSHLLAQASDQGCSVEGIGVGLPGIVDLEGGTMRKGFHRVPELVGAPLVELIRARSGVPVFIDNDVNALALGEWIWGPGRGAGSMVMLALGTGVGGAVILDGHLVRGKSGFGGELGHVSVNFDGRPCVCGIRGCLSAYAAGVGMAAEFHDRTHGETAGSPPSRTTTSSSRTRRPFFVRPTPETRRRERWSGRPARRSAPPSAGSPTDSIRTSSWSRAESSSHSRATRTGSSSTRRSMASPRPLPTRGFTSSPATSTRPSAAALRSYCTSGRGERSPASAGAPGVNHERRTT